MKDCMAEVVVRALEIAQKAHRGRYRWNRAMAVSGRLSGMSEKAVAYLHDVVEDTDVSLSDLIKQGMPENVVMAVGAITKRSGEQYDKYLKRVAENELATVVKIGDLEHNLTNLGKGSMQDKYRVALMFLKMIQIVIYN